MTRVGVGLLVAAFLALPAAAQANYTVTSSGGTLTVTGDDSDHNLQLLPAAAGHLLLDNNNSSVDKFPQNGLPASCTSSTGKQLDCTTAGLSTLHVVLGAADDGFSFIQLTAVQPFAIVADTGAGKDNFLTSNTPATLNGGPGNDTFQSSSLTSAQTYDGGPGDDTFRLFKGPVTVKGSDGFDKVTYEGSDPVTVKLDGSAGSGPDGKATIGADVEDADTGSGNDTIVGNDSINRINSGGGNDTIDAGKGTDSIDAGAGDDTITAVDGLRDVIECGEGTDKATLDTNLDAAADCEAITQNDVLNPDVDGDGASRAVDCNDTNPNIKPGAVDIPDDGIDQNCDGVDATDPDHDKDGSPRGVDCDDSNPAISPRATEIPGNDVDEDCSGVADPFPLVAAHPSTTFAFTPKTKVTGVVTFSVLDIEAGTKIVVACKGKGCPKKGLTKTFAKATKKLDVAKTIKGLATAKFKSGVKLTLTITRAGAIGKTISYPVTSKGAPASSTVCTQPGQKKGSPC